MSHRSLVGVRVLVVDDDDPVRESVSDFLADCGAEVMAVCSARAALTMVVEGKPDVLISDICMPHEDGFWLVRAVRQLPPEHGGLMPAVALTGMPGTTAAALAAGFTEVREKPTSLTELAQLVGSLMTRC